MLLQKKNQRKLLKRKKQKNNFLEKLTERLAFLLTKRAVCFSSHLPKNDSSLVRVLAVSTASQRPR